VTKLGRRVSKLGRWVARLAKLGRWLAELGKCVATREIEVSKRDGWLSW
jgi:hypothetical protein